MQENGYWKRFESTGAVGAYLDYKAQKERAGEKEAQHADNDHGAGAARDENRLHSATGLFCYSEFTLFEGKTMYVVDEAEVREVFWGVHEDVVNMALAMYCAEFVTTLSPTGDEADAQLRLLLNSLYYLSEKKRGPAFIKPVYELRALTLAGFLPGLVACADCVKYEGGAFCFDAATGLLFCAECAAKRGLAANLDAAALAAMRHITYSEDEKLFGFSIGPESLARLGSVVEQYVRYCVDKPFKTLEFYHSVLE